MISWMFCLLVQTVIDNHACATRRWRSLEVSFLFLSDEDRTESVCVFGTHHVAYSYPKGGYEENVLCSESFR